MKYQPVIDSRPRHREIDRKVFPKTIRHFEECIAAARAAAALNKATEAFRALAEAFNYPPALRGMVERRDRFKSNAARLDVWNITSRRQRAKVGRWNRAAAREAKRVKAHPYWNRPAAPKTKWADLAEGPRPGLT